VIVEQRDDTQWVAVAGTDRPEMVLVDSELVQNNNFLSIPVHNGVLTLAEDLHLTVAPFLNKSKTVRITGASVGGAAATVFALKLKNDGFAVEMVVTFGAPKFTVAAGARRLKAANVPLLRVVSELDTVPCLPPRTMKVGGCGKVRYEHFGPALALAEGKRALYVAQDVSHRPPRSVDSAALAAEAKTFQTWANISWLAQDEESRVLAYLHLLQPSIDVERGFMQALSAITATSGGGRDEA
jgi:hypothetical protein